MERIENSNNPHQKGTYKKTGIEMEIHKVLGKGLSEIVYKDAFERKKEYIINYKETALSQKFYADYVVFEKNILEIKSKKSVIKDYYNQVLDYLAISKLEVGLLKNFHEYSLEFQNCIDKAKSANLRHSTKNIINLK